MKMYLDNLDSTCAALFDKVRQEPAKDFLKCTIEDMLPDPKKSFGIGVYLFYDKMHGLEYIGKSGGRSLIERFGGHLDHRINGIMNYYLRMMAVTKKGDEWLNHKSWHKYTPDKQQQMLVEVINELKGKEVKMLYVGHAIHGDYLESLEGVLKTNLKPRLQKTINKYELDGKTRLSDVLVKTKHKRKL